MYLYLHRIPTVTMARILWLPDNNRRWKFELLFICSTHIVSVTRTTISHICLVSNIHIKQGDTLLILLNARRNECGLEKNQLVQCTWKVHGEVVKEVLVKITLIASNKINRENAGLGFPGKLSYWINSSCCVMWMCLLNVRDETLGHVTETLWFFLLSPRSSCCFSS